MKNCPRNRKSVALLSSLLCLVAVAVCSQASILSVSQQGDSFRSIQDALDAAAPFDVIVLEEGTYTENVQIKSALSLVAFGEVTIIPADNTSPAITVSQAPQVVIYGLRVVDAATAIRVVDSSVTLVGCSITASEYGVRVVSSGGAETTILNSTIMGEDAGVGVSVHGLGTMIIEETTLSKLGTAILISGYAKAIISRCSVERCFDGILMVSSASLVALDCELSDNHGCAIIISQAPEGSETGSVTLLGNLITGNGAWGISACDAGEGWSNVALPGLAASGNAFADNIRGDICPEGLLDN